MPREKWTDNRLDSLDKKVDDGYARLEKKVDDGFTRVDTTIRELKVEMNQRFGKVDARFEKIDERFDQLNGRLLAAAVAVIVTLIAWCASLVVAVL